MEQAAREGGSSPSESSPTAAAAAAAAAAAVGALPGGTPRGSAQARSSAAGGQDWDVLIEGFTVPEVGSPDGHSLRRCLPAQRMLPTRMHLPLPGLQGAQSRLAPSTGMLLLHDQRGP